LQLKIDFEEIFKEIEKSSAESILLQLPEGLKTKIIEIVKEFETRFPDKTFDSTIEPCFGACDSATDKSSQIKADLLVHFGHTAISESKKAVYFPLFYETNKEEEKKIFEEIYTKLKNEELKTITVAASVQYLKIMKTLIKQLEEKGINVILSKGDNRVKEEAQVLGCNYSAIKKIANCEAVLLISDAMFHALGLALSTKKRVIFFDVCEMKIRDIKKDKELFLRKRFSAIALAKESNTFGILLSTKKGQMRRALALELKKELEVRGKKAFIFVADYILPEYVLGIDVDCFVNTACPRIAIDDYSNWKKPIINPNELEIALGIKEWEDYRMDEIGE